MSLSNTFTAEHTVQLSLGGREVSCRLRHSATSRNLRIKIERKDEIVVIVPNGRQDREGIAFVVENECWVIEELNRVRRRHKVRRPERKLQGQILFRGEVLSVSVLRLESWLGQARVAVLDGSLNITTGVRPYTPPSQSLENWLRKQARVRIEFHLSDVAHRVKKTPGKVFVMDQRTKWGNCSALGNLSFNWRLIMAPDYVLKYIVTHEVVHLAVPDHSKRFWLMVQSLHPNCERARQWLVANGHLLFADLKDAIDDSPRKV